MSRNSVRLDIGELALDLVSGRAWAGTQEIHLTPREFAVLLYFAQHPGRLVSDTELLDAVWGTEAVVGDAALRAVIKRLRRKLGDDRRRPQYIVTVWGRGYRFEIPTLAPPLPPAIP